jgi:hypothetical protein
MLGRRASDAPPGSLEQLYAAKEIVIHCGSGGVGKTTTAAAAAAEAAIHLGGKVLVLTVDPAKRLANALGLEQFGNVETRVPPEAFAAANVEPRGELWAAMLDTKQSWDDLIRRHAPNPQTRDAILANPLYQNLMGRFVQSHDYIAMERLYDIHSAGTYDLIVVDTPPTRNAIDSCVGSPCRPGHESSTSRRSPSTRSPIASSARSSSRTSPSSSCCSNRCTTALSSERTR